MKLIFFLSGAMFLSVFSHAEDAVEVDTTRVKANKELPKVLYVVPWKEMESYKDVEQKLVLHDFFGDLYDPIIPSSKNVTNPPK